MGMAPEGDKALEHHGEKAGAGHVDGSDVPVVNNRV